ncbi:hypothetical protein F4553_007923 [Allocatelliglobosispora scoriae]|uniref:Sel1 repeat family protein n=1 Tax=Allocatelliglobosispora scoriae TaxID=643052 RepID=A0A841C5B9_9ACTN|nr:sel1 repeat family protein [Allocatelliglobosispora scoriae]MBB5874489.1 hypothetical protein [Allocatelliglobosispora scoriae]
MNKSIGAGTAETEQWARRATQDGDAEAAFLLGRHHVNQPWTTHDEAVAWFERAAQGSDPEMLWRITEAYLEAEDPAAREWLRRAASSMGDPQGVAVDPDTFHLQLDDDGTSIEGQEWSVKVRSDDRRAVLRALGTAEDRMFLVDENGQEHADEDAFFAAQEARPEDDALFTPDDVGVNADDGDPELYLDCQDAPMPMMARTLIRIIIEELRAAGVDRATLYTPSTS